MNDKLLLKLSFFASSLGIFGLFLLSSSVSLEPFEIGSIGEDLVDGVLLVRGEIVSVSQRSSLTLFVVEDSSGRMDMVFFDSLDLEVGSFVEVVGKVGLYKGNLQVVVEDIRFLEYDDSNI